MPDFCSVQEFCVQNVYMLNVFNANVQLVVTTNFSALTQVPVSQEYGTVTVLLTVETRLMS